MNLTKKGGACSLIRQKWAWRWFYSTTETNFPPFLWLMQPTWRKFMKAWSYYWKRLSTTNLSGSYVVISRLWQLLGTQLGYTKFCRFLCEWGARDKKNHYVNKLWPKQTSLTPGEKNVNPLVLPENIFLPHLHIKMGLIKNYVKGMDKTGHGFQYMKNKFPNVWRKNQGRYIYRTPDQATDARQTARWTPEWEWKKCMVVFQEDLQTS